MTSWYEIFPREIREIIIYGLFPGFPEPTHFYEYPDRKAIKFANAARNLAYAYPHLSHEVAYVLKRIGMAAFEERPKAFRECYAAFARLREEQKQREVDQGIVGFGWPDKWLQNAAYWAKMEAEDAERCIRMIRTRCEEVRRDVEKIQRSKL